MDFPPPFPKIKNKMKIFSIVAPGGHGSYIYEEQNITGDLQSNIYRGSLFFSPFSADEKIKGRGLGWRGGWLC